MSGHSITKAAVLIVDELVERVHTESVATWEQRFGRAVLVGPRPLTPGDFGADFEDEDDEPWSFQTQGARAIPQVGEDPLASFRTCEVYALKKATTGAFATTVLIGRASSNDVAIDDDSLSKLHARIELGAAGSMSITDSSSTNGTKLNDSSVGSSPVPIEDGDLLQLGVRTFRVYTTGHFHRLVARLP